MTRPTWILLPALITSLALPALAQARPIDDFRKAKLQSAVGTLTITEARCPAGSTNCGTTQLDETFRSPRRPKVRATSGVPGFATGRRIPGQGTGTCNAESPSTIITGPDGSAQFLSGAARVDPGSFAVTRIAIAAGKRGLRVLWREPLAPGITCDYFNDPATALALPSATQLPPSLASGTIGPRVLKRSRFSITIAGSKEWNDAAADGTQIKGRASWKLRLDYKR